MDTDTLPPLIRGLLEREAYPHPVDTPQLIETHISWVLLAGDYAYKLKKHLDLGFLDYSTLAKRRHACLEELRLNRRLAEELYQAVVAIGGSETAPRVGLRNIAAGGDGEGENLGGEEPSATRRSRGEEPSATRRAGGRPAGDGDAEGARDVLAYAVRMQRFPQAAQLDRMLQRGALTPGIIDQLAVRIADFHATIARADTNSPWGTPRAVWTPVAANFEQIRARHPDPDLHAIDAIEAWSRATRQRLTADFEARKAGGFVRECHGDLHLANVALVHDQVLVFDCIEFSEALRWIDVVSEIAFFTMDLQHRGKPAMAMRFLNLYLEYSGDYEGLRLLRFYQTYRAMVRAKVAAIRLGQADIDAAESATVLEEYQAYVALAATYSHPPRPFLAITHGLSGSGKTTLTQPLLEALGAIRIRSDVERKRLYGLGPLDDSRSAVGTGIYTSEAGARTYRRLEALADSLLRAGMPVIVEATFLWRQGRRDFRRLAEALGVPFVILDFRAAPTTLAQRIVERGQRGNDASEADTAVLEGQIAVREPLETEELDRVMAIDTEAEINRDELIQKLSRKIGEI